MKRRRFVQASSFTALAAATSASGAREQKKPKIKIGQIGTGHAHASGKMQVYRELQDDYEVVGIVEPDDRRWARLSGSGAYRGLQRLAAEQLLATGGLQAVAVETGVADLLQHAEACIDAGVHIHLDKPAGTSLADFQRIIKKADAKNLTVQLGYMYRYNPAVELMRTFLASGWLGEIFEVHAVMSKVVDRGARAALAKFKGGTMFELGCHVIDLVVSVLGKPEKVSPHIRSHGADGLADNMLAVFDYPQATATVRSSGIEVEGFARRHIAVCGTEGSFHIQPLDRPKARIALSRDRADGDRQFRKGIQEIAFEPPYRRYVGDAVDFAKIVRGEKESNYPSSHDLAVQETILRASGMLSAKP